MGLLPGVAMKLVILTALLGLSLAAQADYTVSQFSDFMTKYGKQYNTRAEYNMRLDIFRANLAKIEEHNQSGASWTMAVNKFSDLTQAEFESGYTGYRRTPQSGGAPAKAKSPAKSRKALPDSVDWRDKGVITPAKDQLQCGSCWAFCATEQIESYAAINSPSNELIELSAQQVTACTPNPMHCGGWGACTGAIPNLAYNYIQLFGHVTEADYPYEGGSGYNLDCLYDFANKAPAVAITGYNRLTPNNQDEIMQHLAEVGPLSVAVYASTWYKYNGGVFTGCDYNESIEINHCVQLVGYGTHPTDGDYWLVRNTWGEDWGEKGYILLQRDQTPQCGTDFSPADGTACNDSPGRDQQTVCGMCGVLYDSTWPLGAHEFSLPRHCTSSSSFTSSSPSSNSFSSS